MIYHNRKRNTDPEMMDDPSIDAVSLQQAVEDVNMVNRWLDGFKFTLQAIKKVMQDNPRSHYRILDLGCGDGAMLRYLSRHLTDVSVEFIGMDLSGQSIKKAAEKSRGDERLSFRESDILKIPNQQASCDILLCTLTLHHFDDSQIPVFLKRFIEISSLAVIINDLHRHRIAYLLFKYLSPIFIKHPISRHDGLISIASGFKEVDFKRYAQQIGVQRDRLKWKWSFRYIWTILPHERKN
jgi:SAM-dependent methyltransferase